MQATIVPNVVTLSRVDRLPDGEVCLAVPNLSNDYEGFLAAPAVLQFEGRVYGRSGYDSDLGLVFYRSNVPTAIVLG